MVAIGSGRVFPETFFQVLRTLEFEFSIFNFQFEPNQAVDFETDFENSFQTVQAKSIRAVAERLLGVLMHFQETVPCTPHGKSCPDQGGNELCLPSSGRSGPSRELDTVGAIENNHDPPCRAGWESI